METTPTPPHLMERRWRDAARSGSPDYLVGLHQQVVTWSQLWAFYREHSAESAAQLALGGFFHAAMARAYEDEGSVLDPDGLMYPQLREWARYAVGPSGPAEEALRDSLAGLLGIGLVSPLYFEVVFSAYLEACLEREWARELPGAARLLPQWATVLPFPNGRLTIRWPSRGDGADEENCPPRSQGLSALVAQHYQGWNRVFEEALGDAAGERFDEGGQG